MIRTACIATTLLAGTLLPCASAGAAITLNGRISQIVNALNEGTHFSAANQSFALKLNSGPKILFTRIAGVRNFKDYQLLNDWLDDQPIEQSVFTGGPYKFTHSVLGSYFLNEPPTNSSLFDGSPYKFTHSVLGSYFDSPPLTGEPSIAQMRMAAGPLDSSASVQVIDQPVPEPASWAMMIGGFALVGAALRRRGSTATLA